MYKFVMQRVQLETVQRDSMGISYFHHRSFILIHHGTKTWARLIRQPGTAWLSFLVNVTSSISTHPEWPPDHHRPLSHPCHCDCECNNSLRQFSATTDRVLFSSDIFLQLNVVVDYNAKGRTWFSLFVTLFGSAQIDSDSIWDWHC